MQGQQQPQPKLGRNDPCWCGSGHKYKKCHLDRANEEPISRWDAASALRRAFSAKFCLAPADWHKDCTGQIVKAHTVPRSSSLAKIARDGHVYTFIPSVENLSKNNGVLVPELFGINRASTFSGFCSKHDDAIFAPLEKAPFSGTPEQCFLLGYRAFAREVFTKRAAASTLKLHRAADRGRPLDQQIEIQQFASAYDTGVSAALHDIQHQKPLFDTTLKSGNFNSVQSYVIELDSATPVMCSGSFCPEQDFEGNPLQDLLDLQRIPQLISVNSFYGGNYGAVVFSWLVNDAPSCHPFIASLARIPNAALIDALLRLLFEFCENVHMQPAWWEGLSSVQRSALIHRMAASANPMLGRAIGCLIDDGLRFTPWSVRCRYQLGSRNVTDRRHR